MEQGINQPKKFDLEDRTLRFAQDVRIFIRKLPRSIINEEDGRQLVRASGSVGANYLEANDALGKKDFAMRIRISRKEAKESRYWLNLFANLETELEKERDVLVEESVELIKILSAILKKV